MRFLLIAGFCFTAACTYHGVNNLQPCQGSECLNGLVTGGDSNGSDGSGSDNATGSDSSSGSDLAQSDTNPGDPTGVSDPDPGGDGFVIGGEGGVIGGDTFAACNNIYEDIDDFPTSAPFADHSSGSALHTSSACLGDIDFLRFSMSSNQSTEVTVDSGSNPGELAVRVKDCGTLLVVGNCDGIVAPNSPYRCNILNSNPSTRTYCVEVQVVAGSSSVVPLPYDIQLQMGLVCTDDGRNNGDQSVAYDLGSVTNNPTVSGVACPFLEDWFHIDISGMTSLTLELQYTNPTVAPSAAALDVTDCAGSYYTPSCILPLLPSDPISCTLPVAGLGSTICFVVRGTNVPQPGGIPPTNYTVNVTGVPICGTDPSETNETYLTAALLLRPVAAMGRAICAGDVDWYSVSSGSPGTFVVSYDCVNHGISVEEMVGCAGGPQFLCSETGPPTCEVQCGYAGGSPACFQVTSGESASVSYTIEFP